MKNKAITKKDISIALNLSMYTVSKALKGSHEISAKTQALVQELARQNNDRPNPIAQNLRKGNSKSIAVIIPNTDNNFFSQVINGIESVAFKKDYNVIITQTHESYDREMLNVQHHFSRSIDGLLVSISSERKIPDHFKQVQDYGVPIVFFDRVPDQIKTQKVVSNNFKGTYDATIHLISQGFKRIAQLTSSRFISITEERLAGNRKAMEENNIEIDEKYIRYCAHGGMNMGEIYEAINELLALKPRLGLYLLLRTG